MILGIETSCDETSVALVAPHDSFGGRIVGMRTLSQVAEHGRYGGVVPEIAARSHLRYIDSLVSDLLCECEVDFSDLTAIAATAGPGLIGSLSVGLMFGKSLSYVYDLPFIAVNHLEGHALTVRLVSDISFPYLLLLVSGGHCQLLRVCGVGSYEKLGDTLDDAVGETYDKVARLLGLSYPGGPSVERAALSGDSLAYDFPRPLLGDRSRGLDFSLSGLKSAVRRAVVSGHETYGEHLPRSFIADMCASFQAAVGDIICSRAVNSFKVFDGSYFVVAGGVSSNMYLRERLCDLCLEHAMDFVVAPVDLCTDNGAMIAWAGWERFRLGLTDGLDFSPCPRWPVESLAAV